MTAQRYSATAIFLHWAIALALAFQLALGWRLEDVPKGPPLFAAYQLHKSIGITILLLTLLRLLVRLLRPRPSVMADGIWAERLAKAVHWAFYAVLLLAPLTGWILVSTARIKIPTLLFGVVPWPHLPLPSAFHEPTEPLHNLMAFGAVGLFLLHVAGALRHQFIKDENILGRMVPFLSAGPITKARAGIAAGLALFAVWAAHGVGWQLDFGSAPAMPAAEQQTGSANAPLPIAPTEQRATPPPLAADKPEVAAAPQPLAEWKVAPGGKLGFRADWTGTAVDGRFTRWNARIRFSPDAPEKTTIRVTVDLSSADTADSQRDDSLKSSDFFDVATHPKAVFSATGLRPQGNDRYQARGILELHGKSRPVTLSFTLKIDGDVARVSGSSSLDRTAFGVGSGEWAATDQIAGNVGISFNFTARRAAAP